MNEDASAATPSADTTPAEKIRPARARAKSRNYAFPFGISLALGLLGVAGTGSPVFPLLVMTSYLIYGLATARKEGVIIEFSDSFYYLGFALTLLSLCVALGSMSGFFQTQVKVDILTAFSQALLTTVYGVVGRVWLQLFYRTSQEHIEATNRQIVELSQEYLSQLQVLNTKATTTLESTIAVFSSDLTSRVAGIRKSLAIIDETLQRSAQASIDHAASGEVLVKMVLSLGEAASKASGDLVKEFGQVGRTLSKSVGEVEHASALMARHVKSLDESGIASLRASLRSVVSEAKQINKELGEQVRDLKAEGIGALARAIAEMSQRVREID